MCGNTCHRCRKQCATLVGVAFACGIEFRDSALRQTQRDADEHDTNDNDQATAICAPTERPDNRCPHMFRTSLARDGQQRGISHTAGFRLNKAAVSGQSVWMEH
jgi:hypothetical protein